MADPAALGLHVPGLALPPPPPPVPAAAPVAVVEPEPEPESAGSPVVGALVCSTAGCSHLGSHVALHADTVLPVHCGGCFGLLHCDHAEQATATVRRGTIGAPEQHTATTCRACKTVLAEHVEPLPPIDLASLPVAILDAPLPQ